ncbi:outer membrane protein assembly factor BamB family protein [Natronorarus salvus]|uniref:outer membrane protein assembly factor BamB family protein n=1 Tax=Natronorarus salvus TaxID=3117733 RepID=UPI002F267404
MERSRRTVIATVGGVFPFGGVYGLRRLRGAGETTGGADEPAPPTDRDDRTGDESDVGGGRTEIATNGWLSYRGGPGLTGAVSATGPADEPTVAWTFEPSEVLGRPVAADRRVVVAGTGSSGRRGTLYALAADRGAVEWESDPGAGVGHPPTLVGDLIVVSTVAGDIVAYDRAGAERWRFALGDRPSHVVPGDGTLFAGAAGTTYALDVEGQERWRSDAGGRPAADDDCVYVTDGETVTALGVDDGERRWSGELDAGVIGAPIVRGGTVLAVGETGRITALVGDETAWTTAGDRPTRPAVTEDLVVVGYRYGSLLAYDRTTGEPRWERPDPGVTHLAVAGGTLYTVRVPEERVGEPTPLLETRELDSGEAVRETELPADRPPVVGDRTIYLGGGDLTALR